MSIIGDENFRISVINFYKVTILKWNIRGQILAQTSSVTKCDHFNGWQTAIHYFDLLLSQINIKKQSKLHFYMD